MPPGLPSPLPLLRPGEVLLFGLCWPALVPLGDGFGVVVRAMCDCLEISAEPELARLATARWANLAEVEVEDPDGTVRLVAVLPLGPARLWILQLDSRKVAAESRRWLEGLQADAVEMLLDLPD